jgi:hypothetical protein
MTMSQDNRLNTVNGYAGIPVFPVRLGSGTLKSAAVYKVTFPVYFKHMPGTRNFLGRAKGIKDSIHNGIITHFSDF